MFVTQATWRTRRQQKVRIPFTAFMASLGLWSLFQGLEVGATDFSVKVWMGNVQYLGIVTTITLVFVCTLLVTHREHWLTRRTAVLLTIEPLLVLLLVATSSHHKLFWTRIWLDTSTGFSLLRYDYGIGFWLHIVYVYALTLVSFVLLFRFVNHSFWTYRWQASVIITCFAIPWLANLSYLAGLTLIDLAPVGLTIASLVLIWGLRHRQLLDIVPIARTAVFESLNDAVITLDDRDHVVDLNPAAEALIGLAAPAVIGKSVQTIFADWPALLEQVSGTQKMFLEIEKTQPTPAYFDFQLSLIYHRERQLLSKVIVLRDITARKQAERAEYEQRVLAEALRDAAAVLNNTLDLDEVLERILSDVGRVLPHDTANVMLLRGDVAHFVGYRGYTGSFETVRKVWPLEKTPNLLRMTQTGRPVVIPDVTLDPDWVDTPATRWIRSYVGAPIQRKDEILGFINLDSATPNAYREEHGERLQAFANQAAIALGNARLFAELAERNAELDAYARTIAHDLKSPLGLINGYAELVAEYDLPPMGQAHLDIIRATVGRMEEMIEQLLLLAQLRDVMQTAVSVEVLPLVYAVISRFTDQIEAHKIFIHVDRNLPPLRGHAPWLEEVFANLIGNAIKYIGSDNPEPLIHIRASMNGSMVRYEICDNGLGIKPADQSKLFDMFTRFHRQEASGTGLGLPIVQRIVRKLGGEVGVESEPGRGSTFWFTLPAG